MKLFTLICSFLALLLFLTDCRQKNDVEPQGEIVLPKKMVIVDAEYNKKKDILVYTTLNPNQLNIFHTALNKTETIPLDYMPMSVSISLDGNTAVVGFDGHISHVDLSKKTVLSTYNVSCESLDIVLGSNNWAYVFPKRNQWSTIRCINLSNGKEVPHTGFTIHAGSKAKLHPSGKFIYVTNNFLSPSDIEKFDIQSGTAMRLYDSPYHGDYPIEGDLWFSEDGKKVFLRGQTSLRLSEEASQDLIYGGTVGLDTINNTYHRNKQVMSLDHSQINNKLYLISSGALYENEPNVPYVWVYDATNLSYQKRLPIKKSKEYVSTDTSYIEPHYVFVNSNGNRIFVITKEVEASEFKWAIQTL